MNLLNNKIKQLEDARGFTIVELLIVIVVIGILVGIVVVAYTGITSQANGAASKANAQGVAKVAEAYNADGSTTGYPTLAQLNAYTGYTRIPTGVTVSANNPTAANGKTTVSYKELSTTGGCIGYWAYDAGTPGVQFVYVGAGKTGGGASGAAITCA